ncbi:LacI family transcriptional regulator [Tessaracoccus sp. HDW20]|nr:LacI family transcriptional regulator [Tessaracoccus coleopterorum]
MTVHDVAREARVSIATVSRVLREKGSSARSSRNACAPPRSDWAMFRIGWGKRCVSRRRTRGQCLSPS